MAARPDRWHFTRELLQNTPSRKCGVEPEKELSYRQQSANLIQDMGQRLQVNQLCINTAIVYMHRFYMFQPFTRFPRNSISAACLFLAAKVEEQPHKLEHVLKVAHLCLHRSSPPLDPKSDSYMQQSQELVINESIILQTFAFDVAVSHPHTHVVKCTQMIRASKDLAQTSYFMATNSLHLTTFCLQYKPTLVACVCVHLACKWSQYEIPKSSDDNYWWEYVDPTVTVDLLNQLTMEFLQIIEACPNRLKRRITIHKEQTIAAQKNKKDGGAEDGSMASFIMKPGSQSSIDSGIAELDDLSKFQMLPPHVGSPWLTKPSKDGEKMPGEPAGKPSQSGRVPSKVDITENPQPTKKTIEEYRLEKEKKRKMQEVKVKEDRVRQEQKIKEDRMRQEQKIKEERMRQAKIKQEKRKAYEAQQLLRDEAKVRPKIPPQVPDEAKVRPKITPQVQDEVKVRPKIPPQLPSKHDHSVGRHHPGERPNQPSSKAKLEAGGDQHGRHPKEHTFTSDRDKRHKPVPHPIEGGSSRQPQIKRQPPLPLSVHGKDSTRHPHYKEHHLKTAVPVKTERTEERKVADPVKSRVGGNFKPHSDPKKLRGSPSLQKHQLKKDPVSVKSESMTSLLHKPHLLQEKTQAQRDEDQRLNDELSDIRDEIMKELENDANTNTNSVARGSRSHPAPAAVEKKRNSLENLRQVAREELMHLKKSGIESKLHSTTLATNTATGSKLGADGAVLKSPVKVKEGNRSGHEQLPSGGSSHSPMKKLKSPVKIKRETPKFTTSSGSLSSAKGESSVSKKRALDLGQNALQSDDSSSSFKKAASTPLNSKQEKNNGPLRHLQVGVLLNKELESKPNNSLTTSGLPARKASTSKEATTKNETSYEIEEGEISTSPIVERKIKSDMQNKFMKTLTSTSSAQGEERKRLDASHIIEPQLNQTSIVKVVNSTLPKRDITESVLSKDSLTLLKKENIVTEVINAVSGSQGSQQQSPKHKHKHKEKKKHKKHRQEKPVESAGSPNVESTSILTTSGGIKLKIKGLSSSFPGGSPSEPVKTEQMSNSAGHLPLKNASPISGKEKEHKHRHKHSKSKSHKKDGEGPSLKRSLSPQAAASTQVKKRLVTDGEDWDFHSELPGSLLSLPMPPPDPKKVSPSKHSTVKHKSRKHGIPPPPPPKAGKESPPPPPPPPREPPSGEPLTTVTALPSMDSMPMDPYVYSNQYFNAMLQGNGSLQSSSKSGAHRGKKQPRPPPYS